MTGKRATPSRRMMREPVPGPEGEAVRLRRRAEAVARNKPSLGPEPLTPESVKVLHELRVHQIELEMQNEELRQTQAELEAERARYRDLYDTAPVGYCTLDGTGLILEANQTAATLLGVPLGSLVKTSLARFIRGEDADFCELHPKASWDAGGPRAFDVRMARQDGTEFWAHLTAIPSGAGLPQCRVALSDVTELRRAAEDHQKVLEELVRQRTADLSQTVVALRLSGERFRNLLESITSFVYTVQVEHGVPGKTLYGPGCQAVTGQPPEAFQANPRLRLDIVHEEDREAASLQVDEVLTGHRPQGVEQRILHQDGSVRWVRSTLVPFLDAEGTLRAYDGIIVDITEQKQAEQALREANRRKEEFLATLAHELRNPLVPIRTGAYILSLRTDQDPEAKQLHDMIARQSAHMARLVGDLLDFSRIEQGKVELQKTRVDLALVVTQSMEACKSLLEAQNHRLTLDLPDALPEVEADAVRLEQMLCNLVSNACKFTPTGGEIGVSAAQEGTDAVIRIRDNGLGMTPETVSHSFDLFYQAGKGMDQAHGGLGIGLTLVQQLAQLHGGTVMALSEGPGKGSEFILRLPALVTAPPQPQSVPASAPAQVGRRKHVLIIDDDDQVRATAGMLLEALNYRVTIAPNGEKGIGLAKALRPDIALVDLGMPGLDGLEVAARIRAELGQTIYLVALTGFSREEDIASSKAAGFDHHLVKSGDPRELLDLLNRVS